MSQQKDTNKDTHALIQKATRLQNAFTIKNSNSNSKTLILKGNSRIILRKRHLDIFYTLSYTIRDAGGCNSRMCFRIFCTKLGPRNDIDV